MIIMSRFVDNRTNIIHEIYDTEANLAWLKYPMAIDPTNWQSASQLCSRLKPGQWHLPSVREFMTIIDYNMQEPALHEYFRYMPSPLPGVYWTSNRVISIPNRAWCVDLFNGRVFYEYTGKVSLSNLRTPVFMERFLSVDSLGNAEYVAFVWPVRNGAI